MKEILRNMLLTEGVPEKDHYFDNVIILEKDGQIAGFFTYDYRHGRPHIIHFCTDRKFRNIDIARELIKKFRETVKKEGYREAIIHICAQDSYLNKLVKYYFKKQPYEHKGNFNFYLVEV